jgi:hypothetical protein
MGAREKSQESRRSAWGKRNCFLFNAGAGEKKFPRKILEGSSRKFFCSFRGKSQEFKISKNQFPPGKFFPVALIPIPALPNGTCHWEAYLPCDFT